MWFEKMFLCCFFPKSRKKRLDKQAWSSLTPPPPPQLLLSSWKMLNLDTRDMINPVLHGKKQWGVCVCVCGGGGGGVEREFLTAKQYCIRDEQTANSVFSPVSTAKLTLRTKKRSRRVVRSSDMRTRTGTALNFQPFRNSNFKIFPGEHDPGPP